MLGNHTQKRGIEISPNPSLQKRGVMGLQRKEKRKWGEGDFEEGYRNY